MKRNWMKRARQYRASGVRSRFVAAKWNVVNLSATPRMEGKGKERKREAEQPASDWYEWPTHCLYLFLLLFASSLSQPREKREGFAIDSSTRVVRRHLIHRRMCVIKDFWTIELSARTTTASPSSYPEFISSYLPDTSTFRRGRKTWKNRNWIGLKISDTSKKWKIENWIYNFYSKKSITFDHLPQWRVINNQPHYSSPRILKFHPSSLHWMNVQLVPVGSSQCPRNCAQSNCSNIEYQFVFRKANTNFN